MTCRDINRDRPHNHSTLICQTQDYRLLAAISLPKNGGPESMSEFCRRPLVEAFLRVVREAHPGQQLSLELL